MHPLFPHTRRFLWYLAAWVAVGGLLAYLLATGADLAAVQAWALGLPLALVYAVLCLPVWYTCRAFPLAYRNPAPVLGVHLVAGAIASGLWTALAQLLAHAYGWIPRWQALPQQLASALPLVWTTGLLLYLLAAAGYHLWIGAESTRESERRVLEASSLARDAELRALKAQINPHFLFNSLNSISALTASDPVRARRMCVLLADFLRRTLGLGAVHALPLAEELSLVRAFLAVEQVRFGARLRVEEQISAAALPLPLAPLLLQPLVENAVVHGIAHLVEGGLIRIEAQADAVSLILSVTNDMDPSHSPRSGSTGLGLSNVRSRLAAHYGPEARLDFNATEACFHATLTLPREAAS